MAAPIEEARVSAAACSCFALNGGSRESSGSLCSGPRGKGPPRLVLSITIYPLKRHIYQSSSHVRGEAAQPGVSGEGRGIWGPGRAPVRRLPCSLSLWASVQPRGKQRGSEPGLAIPLAPLGGQRFLSKSSVWSPLGFPPGVCAASFL